jgi:predicted AlkP superfamily phosphohydrolase/phosphomutase
MWHGIDQSHPLHDIASAPAANEGLRRVYIAIDRLIGKLLDSFPDATALVFSMHGMGPNRGDIPSMCLLAELLYRHAFGKPYMREVAWSTRTRNGAPLLSGTHHWYDEMTQAVPPLRPGQLHDKSDNGVDRKPLSIEASNLDWMPVSRYRCFWPKMQAFALPAFYDGRVRINLAGRESHGTVPLERYRSHCREIIELVRKCRDLTNGVEVVEDVHFEDKNPYVLNASEADIYIFWRGTPAGFSHPTLGQIGPIPYYRTGGHTGEAGFLYASKKGISSRDAGLASSFDVVPTIVDLLGEANVGGLSGKSIKPLFRLRSFVSTALRQVAHRMGFSQ